MKKERILKKTVLFWKKINYELIIFFFLITSVFANIDREFVEPWDIYPYVGDYSHGIADKFLTGEIISWFIDYVPVEKVFDIATMLGIFLCVLLSVFSGQVIRYSSDENKNAVIAVVFLLWLLPPGIGGLFRYIGVPDIFMVLALILCIVLSRNNFLYWLVPFISAAAVGFHQIYTLLYFPTLFVFMYYFSLKEKRFLLRICTSVLTLITTFVSFVFITFFSKDYLSFKSVEDMAYYLNTKSDMDFFEDFVMWVFGVEYFSDVATYASAAKTMVLDFEEIFMGFAAILPLIILISYVYLKAMRISTDRKKKFLFLLCSMSWIPTMAACFLMRNVFRIFASLWIIQFLILSLFLYFNDGDFLESFKKTKKIILKNKMIALAYILFIISFGE